MIWWKVILDKDGSIKTAEQVEYAAQGSKLVRFVEANTKAEACSIAKAWCEAYRETRRRSAADRRQARERANLCKACGRRPPKAGCKKCQRCIDQSAEKNARWLAGEAKPRVVRDPEQLRADVVQHDRLKCGHSFPSLLARFDDLGPVAFRAWLVAEIARRTAPAETAAG